jgi:hypothetical protein
LHALQPLQVWSQQTLSAHTPEVHSPAREQPVPFAALGTQMLAALQ